MRFNANYDLMSDIETRYRTSVNLESRAYYSVFYGPLNKSPLLMINANPGGSPSNYRIVDVMAGEHEYVEGRSSGPTTANGAAILQHISGSEDCEQLRNMQVLNRFFRRSPGRPSAGVERAYMSEAQPFLAELINYIEPDAILFGGDSGALLFADAHGGTLSAGQTVMGPNGSNEAVYFREYRLSLPYYRPIAAYGIYHPSKLNGHFRREVFPILRSKIGPLF